MRFTRHGVIVRGVRHGNGTGQAVALVRDHVPFLGIGGFVPDIVTLADAVRRGELAIATPSPGDIDADRA